MDLRLVVENMVPNENVSPDFSSYDAMVAMWRGSVPPPSLQEIEARAITLEKEMFEEKRKERELQEGVTDKAKLEALWKKFMDGQAQEADDLKVVIDTIKTDIPEPTP